jgi:hypothetical protein
MKTETKCYFGFATVCTILGLWFQSWLLAAIMAAGIASLLVFLEFCIIRPMAKAVVKAHFDMLDSQKPKWIDTMSQDSRTKQGQP